MLLANRRAHEQTFADAGWIAPRQTSVELQKWAVQLGTTPQCAGESDVAQNKATDLVLYVLIWGEAANLRHVPESALLSLSLDAIAELWSAAAGTYVRPQGWFLSRVIAPLYRHMRAEMNKKGARGKPLGHTCKPNYDDFNEFFWSSRSAAAAYQQHDSSSSEPRT